MDFHPPTAFDHQVADALFQMGSLSPLSCVSSLCPGPIASALLNSITSPPPAVRSIRMMNRSPDAGVLSDPLVATARNSRQASTRCLGDRFASWMIPFRTSGVARNRCCAFSRVAAPFAMRRSFSRCTAWTNGSLSAKRAQALSFRPYFDLIWSSGSSPSVKRQQSTIKPHPISLSRSISMPRRITLPRCEFESTSMLRPHSCCPDGSERRLGAGLNKVKAETALSVLAYNILRAINLVGASGLRAAAAKAQSDQLQVDIQVALLRNLLEQLRRDTEAREEDHQRREQDLRQDRDLWQRR